MSPVDKNGIPIVQASSKIGSKRKSSETEDEIKLCRPQNKHRNIEYFRTSSSSPQRNSHVRTEPLRSNNSFSPLNSRLFASDMYLKPKGQKRQADVVLVSSKTKLLKAKPILPLTPNQDAKAAKDNKEEKGKGKAKDKEEDRTDEDKAIDKKVDEDKPAVKKADEEKTDEEKTAEEKPAVEKPAEGKPAEGKPAEGKPSEEKSAEEKPAEEKPAEEKPAEEKPAEEKPAEEKPAEEKPADEKDEEEMDEEEKEIADLMKKVKCLPKYYKLVEKIGEGTFSSVYKAIDLRREYYDNDEWKQGLAVEENKISQFVALKQIYNTSSPLRIANEIEILCRLRGVPCVSPIITSFRDEDQVFVVMPFVNNDDFRDIFFDMTLKEVKSYMKSLLTALKGLEEKKVIHRDVKPNNFLFDLRKQEGMLIDFGLAEDEAECQKLEEANARIAARAEGNLFFESSKEAAVNRKPVKQASNAVLTALSNKENRATDVPSSSTEAEGPRMGYVKNDARPHIKANRAGTRGFRAPEILMKVTRQTCAVDVWSAGVILISFMTGKYPFFIANDESDALVELCQVFGLKAMKNAAQLNDRNFSTNIKVPTSKLPFFKLVQYLNQDIASKWGEKDLRNGADLLEKCLDLNHRTRITAKEALEHPFFS